MTPRRLLELLVAHALADGEPLGPVLRGLPLRDAVHAAESAEAGRLGEALSRADLAPDLVRLAVAWPAALLPALRRLSRMPSRLIFLSPVHSTSCYFAVIAVVQIVVLVLLGLRIEPALGMRPFPLQFPLLALDVVVLLQLAVLNGLLVPERGVPTFPPWKPHLAQARDAALAGALREANAPEEVFHRFVASRPELAGGGPVADLDLVLSHALAAADAHLHRFLTVYRVLGYSVLIAIAAITTAVVYHSLAWAPVSI